MRYGEHAYYKDAWQSKVEEANMRDVLRFVVSDLKAQRISRLEAITTLRNVGMFEAEIREALPN